MALYLVQHGKALPKDRDPERGLSQEGISEVRRIAEVARGYGVRISRLVHSGKKRASQTAELFHAIAPQAPMERIAGIAPLDDVAAFANRADLNDDLMIVGHLPFLEKLTSYLITGREEPVLFKFQNGGIVCLDTHPETNGWLIKWALMPNIG